MSREKEWEVESIIRRGSINNSMHYLVKWKGFSIEDATWEPITNLHNCQQAIIEFEKEMNPHAARNRPHRESRRRGRRISMDRVFPEAEGTEATNLKDEAIERQDENAPIVSNSPESDQDMVEPMVVTSRLAQQSNSHIFSQGQGQCETEVEVIQSKAPIAEKDAQRQLCADQYQEGESFYQPNSRKMVKLDELEVNPLSKGILEEGPKEVTEQPLSREVSQEESQRKKQFPSFSSENQEELISKGNMLMTKPGKVPQKSQQTSENESKIIKLVSNCEAVSDFEQRGRYQSTSKAPIVEKKLNPIIRNLQRYEYCDNVYGEYRINMLKNITRKMENKARVRPAINMIDMTQKREFLKEFANIKEAETETAVSKVELLVKADYGWLAIGMSTDKQYIMLDVNLISEQCWSIIVSTINERKQKA